MEAQLKPYARRLNEINQFITDKNTKKAKRLLEEFKSSKVPSFAQQYLQVAEALVAKANEDDGEAIAIARQIELTKPTDPHIVNGIIQVFRSFGYESDILPIYKRMYEKNPADAEVLSSLLTFYVSHEMFKDAQTLAMSLLRAQNSQVNLLFAAVTSYLRAETCAEPQFYSFAVNLIDKAKTDKPDTVELRFNSLLKLNRVSEALAYCQSADVQQALKHNQILLKRMKLKALDGLGQRAEASQVAVDFLKEIHPDSLDEWKYIVKNHPNAQSVIQSFENGKLRGPELAAIELAISSSADPSKLVAAYAEKHQSKGYVFGDLYPYLTAKVCESLTSTTDQSLRAYATGEFIGSAADGRSASILAQILMKKYLETKDPSALISAISECSKFEESPDSMVMLIRLCGLLGASAAQEKQKAKLRLDAIQFLSLAGMYQLDPLRVGDFEASEKYAKEVESFVTKSVSSFYSYLSVAMGNFNFLLLPGAAAMNRQIGNHISSYLNMVIGMWFDELGGRPINMAEHQRLVKVAEIEKMEIKTDYSCIPIYVRDDRIKDMMYPSLLKATKVMSCVVRALHSLKLKENCDAADELLRINELEDGWKEFAQFVKGAEISSESDNLYQLGSIAMAAKIMGNTNIRGALTASLDKCKIDEVKGDMPAVIRESIEEQKARLQRSVARVKALLV